MIRGLGLDVTDLSRFEKAVAGRPLLAKVFTEAEQDSSLQRMAGRFAAKEALAKALGSPGGLTWHDVEVLRDEGGRPYFRFSGSVARLVADLGITAVHLSITHDAGIAAAVVVCEG